MAVEKYKQAWKRFQAKMTSLRKKRSDVVATISKKLDQQQLESVKKRLNMHE
jgi:hypothetical protein